MLPKPENEEISKATASHLFVSASGRLLPRWREAFPAARSVTSDALTKEMPPSMVWLRLAVAPGVADQLASVRARFDSAPIVVLSDTPSDDEALQAFSAAAKGYCNAHATAELLTQVEAVVGLGGLWIGESLMHRMVGALSNVPVPESAPRAKWNAGLTEREREVVRAVCSGQSNKEVARTLGITERTVKAHVGAVLEKLKVRDRLQLALLVKGLS